jgi:transporter family-2 protein
VCNQESTMHTLLVILAIGVGTLIPLEAGANARAALSLGSRLQASLLAFLTGAAALSVLCMINGAPVPGAQRLAGMPWWAWTGGLIGATFVASTVALSPRLGVLLFLAAAIFGQMLASAIIDHFGLVGFDVRPMTTGRLVGLGLILAGVAMIRYL